MVDLLLPADAKEGPATVMVGALVAIPAVRILWLVVRWFGKGDRRFAVAGLVLAVMGSGLLLG